MIKSTVWADNHKLLQESNQNLYACLCTQINLKFTAKFVRFETMPSRMPSLFLVSAGVHSCNQVNWWHSLSVVFTLLLLGFWGASISRFILQLEPTGAEVTLGGCPKTRELQHGKFLGVPNQVRNSQTSCFILVLGQNPGRSSWGDSIELWLQSVRMEDMWWRRSRIGKG